jgi:hypothetical protein
LLVAGRQLPTKVFGVQVIVFLVIFSLATAGSLVCLSAELLLKFAARKAPSETVAMGSGRGGPAAPMPRVDPVLTFGWVLACYGAIALGLVSALPGALALERTMLAFALLCVGGLVGEIASTGTTARQPALDGDDEPPAERKPISLPLSVALMLTLNLTVAVVSAGQGLIEIVPPVTAPASAMTEELDPIVVIAMRHRDPLDPDTALF